MQMRITYADEEKRRFFIENLIFIIWLKEPNPRKTVSVYKFSRPYVLITLNLIRLIYAQQ